MAYYTQSNRQILYSGLWNTIQSYHSHASLFHSAFGSFPYLKHTKQALASGSLYFPSSWISSPSAIRWLAGSLKQFRSLFKYDPLSETFPYHIILKCSSDLFHGTLCATLSFYFVYISSDVSFFVHVLNYHYLTFPIRMWSFWWQRILSILLVILLLPRKKEQWLTQRRCPINIFKLWRRGMEMSGSQQIMVSHLGPLLDSQ